MNGLFGVELPTPVTFVIAFVFVLLLIGVAAWVLRRFGGGTRIDAAARNRQPRLAVVDSAAVDGRRKLVIVRRDNVEHLLMIGGPSDVVVETNIVRAAAVALRDIPPPRTSPEAAPRMPQPDPTAWPLQPESLPAPVAAAAPPARTLRAPAEEAWEQPEEPAAPVIPIPEVRPMRPADTLAGLAEEFAPPVEPAPARPVQLQAPRVAATQPLAAVSQPQPSAASDQSLAEMAQRLEAALRRPMAQKIVAETPRVTATLDVKAVAPKSFVPPQQRAAAAAKPQQPQQSNLEQEMASLLGRPGKT